MKLKLNGRMLCCVWELCLAEPTFWWTGRYRAPILRQWESQLRKDWDILNLLINVSTNAQVALRPKEGEEN